MSYDNNINNTNNAALKSNSYSDLFEDFFRTDATSTANGEGGEIQDFSSFGANQSTFNHQQMIQDQQSIPYTNDMVCNEFYPPQLLQAPSQVDPYFLQQQYQLQAAASTFPMMSAGVSVSKPPGFIRNRTRKNIRQKSVAAAVKANQLLASAASLNDYNNSAYALNYQQAAQLPFYNYQAVVASQQFQMYPSGSILQQQQQQQQQQQVNNPPVLMAKSPVKTASIPSSPRSPTSTTSDYIKLRLQQKIRSRMVSKGQIPPNPTEEELRMCGVQFNTANGTIMSPSSASAHHNCQLPTPNASPQQVPRAFNSAAAFIAAPLQQNANDDIMNYLDFNNHNNNQLQQQQHQYSQKDPLSLINNTQNKSSSTAKYFKQQTPAPSTMEPSQSQDPVTINYDQFFSDFILY